MLKIDTHAHIPPRDWPNLAEKYADDRFPVIMHTDGRHRIYKGRQVLPRDLAQYLGPAAAHRRLRPFGVQTQVIPPCRCCSPTGPKPHQALELHRHLNDHTAEVCRAHPRHYAGIGTVPLQSPTLAIQEMERCVEQLGLAGVQIGSHVEDWNLDAPELFPLSRPPPILAPPSRCTPGT